MSDRTTQAEHERQELESLGLAPPAEQDPAKLAALMAKAESHTPKPRSIPEARSVLNVEPQQVTPEILRLRMQQEVDEEEASRSRRSKRRDLDREIRADRWKTTIPVKFHGAKLENLPEPMRKVATQWLGADKPTNLILTGAVGVGKSFMAYCLARELYIEHMDVLIRDTAVLLDEIKPNVEHAEDSFKRFKSAGFLFLEDLGLERRTSTGWADERLHLIIDHRWQWDLPTIVTTNVSELDLFDLLGERTASRLMHGVTVLNVKGEDRRLT